MSRTSLARAMSVDFDAGSSDTAAELDHSARSTPGTPSSPAIAFLKVAHSALSSACDRSPGT